MQFAGPAFTFPLTREQLDGSLSDKNRHAFALVDSSCDCIIGHAEIYLTVTGAFLGRILIGEKQFRGKGIGQQIVRNLLEYAFINLNQQKIQLNVFDWNIAAIRCYAKAGFVIIPGKSAHREVNGQNWTVLRMAIERQEWALLHSTNGQSLSS
jgi:RimJ/RimL family protein N-acetyltransferase